MPVDPVTIGAPFFVMHHATDEAALPVAGRAIALNLGDEPVGVAGQAIPPLCSAIVQNCEITGIRRCLLIEGFDGRDDDTVMAGIRAAWPTAFEVRGEARLKGVAHFMSPKVRLGQIALTLYHSASVPLNVGLHREHPFCPVPGFREVHTQIMGLGKMQQCRERDVSTLYMEEVMAPGHTHRPMFDARGNYPWHQFETITPSVLLAVEILPDGVPPPEART